MNTNPDNPLPSTASETTSLESAAAESIAPTIAPDRGVPAWLFSVVLHSILLLVLFLILRPTQRGAGNIESRTGGIVLVDMQAKQTEFLSEGEVESTSSDSAAADSPPPSPSPSEELPPELPGLDTTQSVVSGVGEEFTQELPGADELLESVSENSRPVGGEVTTEIFGVKGTGTRFVYVFDRSASMEGYSGKPLKAAKQQLLRSIQSLGSVHQFQIIFYNDGVSVFRPNPGQPEMLFASDDIKKKANSFVNSIVGDRGTDHLSALKAALSLGPDVVFLLTDAEGGLSPAELAKIAGWNRSGAVINTVEFGINAGPGSDRSLQKLSRENGGQYSYKNISTLRVN